MHLLLVSYYYRPDPLSGTRRLGMIVDALRARGCKVTVLAGGSYSDFEETGVVRPRYFDLWKNMHRAAKRSGLISFYKKSVKRGRLSGPIRPMGWTSFSEVQFPDRYLTWIRPAVRLGKRLIEVNRFDVIMSSFPAPSSAVVARRLKAISGLPWIAELRDLWSDSPHDVPMGTFGTFNRWYERRVLGQADAFVAVTKGIGRVLTEKYRRPVETIYSPIASLSGCSPVAADGIFRIVYTGALYSGSRDTSPLVRAIKMLEARGDVTPKTLQFRYFGFDDRASIEAMFARFDALPYLYYGGLVSRDKALEEQRRASLLYVVPVGVDARFDGIMTAKVFEYVGHRRPVLATSVPGGELDLFLRQTGCGVGLADAGEIASALSRWVCAHRTGDVFLGEFCPDEAVLSRYTAKCASAGLLKLCAMVKETDI